MRRRIVLFTPGHAESGGAQRRSKLIAEGLLRRGWEVRVITRAGTLRRPRLDSSKGLKVVEVPGFGRRRLGASLFFLTALPLGLAWGLRARAFLSVQLMSTTTAAGICSLLLRRPYIALATTSGELGEVRYLSSTRLAPLRFRLLRRAAYVVAQTTPVAEDLEGVVPRERIVVIPNPVKLPDEAPPLPGSSTALFAGRLSEEKDLFCLLEAWRRIVTKAPSARLILAGSGGSYRSVEGEIRNAVSADPALQDSVAMPGWVWNLDAYLRNADVFVLPSREEGMSNALLEACAAERVVIASDIPSNRAVVGDDYPLLFQVGDAEALSACIESALAPDQELREEARAIVRERIRSFSVDAVLGRLEALIDAADSARS